MKTVIWLSSFGVGVLAHPSGLWWGTDQCFPSPENTDNQCLEPQKTGFDWSDLGNGDYWSYEGFNFVGFTPNDACGSSGGKCIEGKLSRDDNYAIRVEATQAPFSVSSLHLATSRDTAVILNYQMADGSTCRQLAWSSTDGADITNEQCGNAVAVEFTLPEDSKFGECDMSIHRMDFDCSTGTKPPAEIPHSSYTHTESTSTYSHTHPESTSTYWDTHTEWTSTYWDTHTEWTSTYWDTHTESTSTYSHSHPESTSTYWDTHTEWTSTYWNTHTESSPSHSTVWQHETTTVTIPVVPTESWTTSTIWSTEEITVTSCAPTVTDCPAHSTVVVTSTWAASTTVCPPRPTTDIVSDTPPSRTNPSSPGIPTAPVVLAPCPELVPKCLNTWLSVPKCDSNSDAACFCPSSEFTEKVSTCIHSWGTSEEEIDSALSYFAGICAPYVPKNPEIIDIVPPSHTVTDEVPHHTGEVPHHTGEVPHHTGEVPHHTDEVPHRTDEIPYPTNEVPHHTGEVPHHTDEVPHRTDEIPYPTGEVPHHTDEYPHHTVTAPAPGITAPSEEEITPAPTAPKTPCTTMSWHSRTVTAPLVEFSTIHVGSSSSVALVPGTKTDTHSTTSHRTTCSTSTTSTSTFTTSTSSKTTTCITHVHKPTGTPPVSNGGSRVLFPSMWAVGMVLAVMWLE
ncbi:Putative Extracellular serine-threonine rich protein [Penicillium brasilianum]|uniref:Putative Extracellular serine-threonine rich protein n=1 Tax=Penicillium brasilianum TaxID=104259 RepID=A0A0F7TE67_PENBI|nr:Putative Extracellular serine-threonine rich protein [Penicillium brasilianum]